MRKKLVQDLCHDALRNQLQDLKSIHGMVLTKQEIDYLIEIADKNNIYNISPASPIVFSKPRSFFMQHIQKSSLTFVKNGKEMSVSEIELENGHFIAYLLDKPSGTIKIYAYYPEELD